MTMKNKPQENMTTSERLDLIWSEAKGLAAEVSQAYADFYHAVDALSVPMGYRTGYLVDKLVGGSQKEKANLTRFMKWFEGHESQWRRGHIDYIKQVEKTEQQDALIKQLGLTEEQKEILGIE